jgi:hypothetical protein
MYLNKFPLLLLMEMFNLLWQYLGSRVVVMTFGKIHLYLHKS